MRLLIRCLLLIGMFTATIVPQVHAQSGTEMDLKLRILEPTDEIQNLDPAFEMIMEKIDDDLRFILSSPVRSTPKGTAITGLTLLGTLLLLNEDEKYLSDTANAEDNDSDDVLERLRVVGRNVPGTAAGLYLLGYFFDNRNLKSRSLEGLEAVAITALITGGSSFIIGHKGPDDSADSVRFEPFSKYHSMPDMDSSLIFALASVYAYEKSTMEALVYYGIAAGAAYSRLHFEDAWPSDVFLGSVLGTAIGRTIAARSQNAEEKKFTLVPVLEQNGQAALGLMVEFKL